MKRKHKNYSKPKRPFDKARIEEEAIIKKDFGLKNKKEIWKAEAKLKSIRERAKKLIKEDLEEQKTFFEKLKKIGLKVKSIAEVLSLDKRDVLNRRLVNVPGYIVPIDLEDKITLKVSKKKIGGNPNE